MCGITGVIHINSYLSRSSFEKSNNIIRHRGPDDEGYVLFRNDKFNVLAGQDTISEIKEVYQQISDVKINEDFNIALGHRRLSILDLSHLGHQPLSNDNGDIWITYNGEIYNYIEIRNELTSLGYRFKSNTDTEVIIKAYEAWGIECIQKFNGMWAFCIYDIKYRKVYICRDRFGIKPLYYYRDSEKFVFASEIKQILEYKNIAKRINEKKVYDYLMLGQVDFDDETFFENINIVQPSTYIEIDLKDILNGNIKLSEVRYWDLEKNKDNERKDENELFRNEFIRSLRYMLRSDAPIGCCLSGGLDSSAIVCGIDFIKNNSEEIIDEECNNQTFTACYDESYVDEREYSDCVLNKCNFKGNNTFPTINGLKNDLEKIVWHQDEPFQSLSIYAQWEVFKLANDKNIKVMIDGQGGDEVLLGYERYYAFYLVELLKKCKFKKFKKEFFLISKNSKLDMVKLFQYIIYFNIPFVKKYNLIKRNKKFLNKKFHRNNCNKRIDKILKEQKYKSIDELQTKELFKYNLPKLLRYEDRNSMAFSIESRVPYLDYKLVNNVFNVEFEKKIRNGWSKSLIRNSMKDILPEKIRLRKNKMGFETPQEEWLTQIKDDILKEIEDNYVIEKFINKSKFVDHLRNDESIDKGLIWRIYNLNKWIKVFKLNE